MDSTRDLYWKGVYRINNRPRKVLGWKTAQECFAEELRNSAWDLALGVKIHRFSVRPSSFLNQRELVHCRRKKL